MPRPECTGTAARATLDNAGCHAQNGVQLTDASNPVVNIPPQAGGDNRPDAGPITLTFAEAENSQLVRLARYLQTHSDAWFVAFGRTLQETVERQTVSHV